MAEELITRDGRRIENKKRPKKDKCRHVLSLIVYIDKKGNKYRCCVYPWCNHREYVKKNNL